MFHFNGTDEPEIEPDDDYYNKENEEFFSEDRMAAVQNPETFGEVDDIVERRAPLGIAEQSKSISYPLRVYKLQYSNQKLFFYISFYLFILSYTII